MRIWLMIWTWLVCVTAMAGAQDGLAGHWGFDDGNGDVALDNGPGGSDGEVLEARWVDGVLGGALDFDPGNQAYVKVAPSDALDVTEGMTLMAWVNPRSIYIGDDWKQRNCIAAKLRAYYLDIDGEGHLAAYFYGLDPQQWMVGTTSMETFLNTWTHVATTWDGSHCRLYINGELEAEEARGGQITVNADPFTIGYVDNNRYFDGLIDEVYLYNRALEGAELRQFSTLAVEPDAKLGAVWADLRTHD